MTKLDMSPSATDAAPPRSPIPDSPPGALPVLMGAVFMIVLDFFAVDVALPSMPSRL